MKLFSFFIAMLLSSTVALAQNVTIIVPNPAGSQGDSLMRILQEEYDRLPGKKMTLDYAPGGQHVVAVNKFLNSSDPNIILNGSATLNVFNPLLMKGLSYKDTDFHHIGFIGIATTFYISNNKYQTIDEMLKNLANSNRPIIGGYASAHNINFFILQELGLIDDRVKLVNYKGAPNVLVDILGNHIDVGVVAITEAMVQNAKSGQVKLLGNSTNQDLVINGMTVPSVSKKLNVPQMTSGFFLSAKPNANPAFLKEFETDIKKILGDPKVKERILQIHVYGDPIMGHENVSKFIQTQRNLASAHVSKLGQ